ncbi:MAG: hypothetical protein H7246_18555 [Phycisphaerae bacterium]|nr:hypothetical protein [Saprospiraceae bacterium]
MKYIFNTIFISIICIGSAFSQGDTTYLASTPINAAGGFFAFELMNVELSQLTPAQSLWVYGDGNFDIKLYDAATHQFRIAPVEEVFLYSIGHYDDGEKPRRKKSVSPLPI